MSGHVDFLLAKKSAAKAILKSQPNACTKWPSVSWKWLFPTELSYLYAILRQWPKKAKVKDEDAEQLQAEIEEVGKAHSKEVDEEMSAAIGKKTYGLVGILFRLPPALIDLIAQTDEKNDLELATRWHKYYDHWAAAELTELIRDLRRLCQTAQKEKSCVFLLDNCMY